MGPGEGGGDQRGPLEPSLKDASTGVSGDSGALGPPPTLARGLGAEIGSRFDDDDDDDAAAAAISAFAAASAVAAAAFAAAASLAPSARAAATLRASMVPRSSSRATDGFSKRSKKYN
jgi:hypothetical protein